MRHAGKTMWVGASAQAMSSFRVCSSSHFCRGTWAASRSLSRLRNACKEQRLFAHLQQFAFLKTIRY